VANDNPLVVWVGPSQRSDVQRLLAAFRAGSFRVECVEELEALGELAKASPRAIVLGPDLKDAVNRCLSVRMHAQLSAVPVLWLRSELDDLVFAEAFGVGGDDVATMASPDGILRRLQMLPDVSGEFPSRGLALVAEAEDQPRIVLARLLRNAGFDVCFAGSIREMSERLESDDLKLVVAALELPDGGSLGVFKKCQAEGKAVPWVIATPPKKLRETSESLKGSAGAWVWDSYAPPENVLYAANEALRGSFAEQRASPRLLFGTTVAFRLAGRDRDEHGFVYNVSGEGMFIRTLAPLSGGEDAWLEFKPPRTDRLVRLDARVVWRKPYGRVSEATVPPGFGVQITGGSKADMRRYRDGYRALAEQFAGIRFSSHPSGVPEAG